MTLAKMRSSECGKSCGGPVMIEKPESNESFV